MSRSEGLLAGKRGLIMGVANDRSIAWGIARAAADHGADLAFTYQNDALLKRVGPLAEAAGSDFLLPCDVADSDSLDFVFREIGERWGTLDFVLHAIAFSDKDELKGRYVDTSATNFEMSMNISCYSFTAVCQRASAMMPAGGSLLTLTYSGAERVMPHYNVMGVAKAALEASVKYLAADLGPDGIRVNARAIQDTRGAKLIGCFDNVPAAAERLADATGCRAYRKLTDMLDDPDLDIVTIGTPSGAHLEPALQAAQAGKHVIVEKPLEITLARCDRIIRACREHRVKLATIFPSRFHASSVELKRAMDAKRFGRLTLAMPTSSGIGRNRITIAAPGAAPGNWTAAEP